MRVTSTELRAAIVGHVDYDRDHRYGLNALALIHKQCWELLSIFHLSD